MIVESEAFEGGKIPDKYGKRGKDFGANRMPTLSFPFKIVDPPQGTASFAVVFDDPDSVPVCGFKWIHWTIQGLRKESLPEDASRNDKELIQGANSWYKHGIKSKEDQSCYGGPAPPDRPHKYVLTVYALDFVPALKTGFEYESLMKLVDSHVLAKATIKGIYDS